MHRFTFIKPSLPFAFANASYSSQIGVTSGQGRSKKTQHPIRQTRVLRIPEAMIRALYRIKVVSSACRGHGLVQLQSLRKWHETVGSAMLGQDRRSGCADMADW